MYETQYGLGLLPAGRRRNQFRALRSDILAAFEGRILSLDQLAAELAAEFRARAGRNGRPIDVGDALMAGIARANDMAMATRNVRDFALLGMNVINPWESA